MSFADKMNQMKSLEEEIGRIVFALNKELEIAVANQPFKGRMISDGSNGGPLIGVVTLSQLRKSKNWTPEYHLPPAQAKAVRKKLESCKTPRKICKAVREMISERKVRMGNHNDYIYLNEETLRILRESEIGQYLKIAENVD